MNRSLDGDGGPTPAAELSGPWSIAMSVNPNAGRCRPRREAATEPPAAGGSGRRSRPVTHHPVETLIRAAALARCCYPRPVGELVSREILAHTEIGHRFGGDGLVRRLVDHLLATAATGDSSSRGLDRPT